MVLLAILAVGMLGISSVALRSAVHGKADAEARANARLGLMLALGQLQKLAGDDRRVTATADLEMEAASAHGSRYWTGVWSNAAAAGSAGEIYTSTPEAQFEGWLVSGEREGLLNPDSTTVPLGSGVTLVGAGTAGELTSEHVTVPLVEVDPGLGKMAGRYGWWIGDEGVKTRGNLPSTGDPAIAATDLTLGARGGGWETLDGMENYPGRGAHNEADLTRIFTSPSLSVAVPSVRATAPQHFHSLTMHSRGLLTDTLAGGLRMDLTPFLENGFPSDPASDDFPNAPVSGRNILPSSVAPQITGPTWDRLRALSSMKPTAGGKLDVVTGNGNDEALIAPVIFDFRVLMGAKIEGVSPAVEDPPAPAVYKIHACGKIAVSLANPYPYPIQWGDDLELEVFQTRGVQMALRESFNTIQEDGSIKHDSGQGPLWPKYFSFENEEKPSVFGGVTFKIPAGELGAGESRTYTQGSALNRAEDFAPVSLQLSPFLESSPSDFNNSILLPNTLTRTVNSKFNSLARLHLLANGKTSTIDLELRTSDSGLLRRIESFDVNNVLFKAVERRVSAEDAAQMTEPIPLMLFSYQLSQPGMDYGAFLPAGQLGRRNSTLRTFMDFNLRAQHFTRPIASYTAPPYFMAVSDDLASLPFSAPGGDTGTAFTRNLALSELRWGHSSASGTQQTILYDVPDEIVSLAQFQHADLTADDHFGSVAHQPGNALGNSYAPLLVERGLSSQPRYDYNLINDKSCDTAANRYYDMSYLLNAALWDSFFISTVPADGPATPENPRITEILSGSEPDALRDPIRAASRLWVQGGFNVNSTSKDAWKAMLASNRKLKHPAESDAPEEGVMFPRSLNQPAQAQLPDPSGDGDDSYSGFRRITDEQLDALAGEIVRQVRLRGPFVSLSHFVNRALVELSEDEDHLGRSGVLQSAIDDSGLNMVPGTNSSRFTDLNPQENMLRIEAATDGKPAADMEYPPDYSRPPIATNPALTNDPNDTGPEVWAPSSQDGNPANTGSMVADREMITDPELMPEQGFRSTGIPGWLTQADVLQVIGPVISARSDTFRIRAYGEALDSSGKTVAKAWCEAIVQRTPEFMDSADSPETRPENLNPSNVKFGRRFSVVSFRWLHPDEI